MPSYVHTVLGCALLIAVSAAIPVPVTPESPLWHTPAIRRAGTSSMLRSDSSLLRSALRSLHARPPPDYGGKRLKDLTRSEMKALGLATTDATLSQGTERAVKRREAKARWAALKRHTLRREVKRPNRFHIEQPRQGF
ncbi:hypothetical protein T484DRAFT_1742510 [Baffinella frigidus]|nr:hypothetical protein T484DRAFT_1742510 [Cryptophyta sp. CCMP2293]